MPVPGMDISYGPLAPFVSFLELTIFSHFGSLSVMELDGYLRSPPFADERSKDQ